MEALSRAEIVEDDIARLKSCYPGGEFYFDENAARDEASSSAPTQGSDVDPEEMRRLNEWREHIRA